MNLHGVLVMLTAAAVVFPLVSCRKPEKVVVTETRELTMFDTGRASLVATMPPEWRQIPRTQLRIFNYRFGTDGEVYVSRSRGGILPNANRWLGQFGKPGIEDLEKLPKLNVLGREAIVVDALGDFGGAMGKPARENAALLGVLVDLGGEILSIKMIGSADAVAAERKRMINFCESLRINDAASASE